MKKLSVLIVVFFVAVAVQAPYAYAGWFTRHDKSTDKQQSHTKDLHAHLDVDAHVAHSVDDIPEQAENIPYAADGEDDGYQDQDSDVSFEQEESEAPEEHILKDILHTQTKAESRAVEPIQHGTSPTERELDPEAKKKNVENFLADAITFFNSTSTDKAFAEFNHGTKFRRGELYLFVYDTLGTCLAHGEDNHLLWENLYNLKDSYGVLFVQALIEKAKSGGGWVTYQWHGAAKLSFVKTMQKDGKTYVIGTGYYPHSKMDAVVNLVKGAVALFDKGVKEGRSIDESFSTLSYPLGRFVFGDLYLYALDFNGLQVAHGELPGIIGTNAWTYRDTNGKLVNQEIIGKLKTVPKDTGVWIDYISKNAPKKAYAEKVTDSTGKSYFIACGYYPDADNKQAVNLVERAYRYMKLNGKTQAIREFTDKADMEFRYGDLYVFVFDTKGVCIAHGGNSSLVGTNMYNDKDEDGDFYVRDFINKAQKNGYGWIDYREKNAFKTAYVEKIDIGEEYIIGCSVQPITKRETMLMLGKSGADFFKATDLEKALREFVRSDGRFIRGDLNMFVIDTEGICLANGDDYAVIWQNLMPAKDDSGKQYIKLLINTVKQNRGPATISYRLNGATRIEYSEPISKNGKQYLVGAGFYL